MHGRAAVVLIHLVLGCGRVGYGAQLTTDGTDASPSDSGDVPADGGRNSDSGAHSTDGAIPSDAGALDAAPEDGGSTDAGRVDGGDGGPILGDWGIAARLDGPSSVFGEHDPSFTEDRLELYFISNRTGAYRVYRSTRDTVSDPWGPAALVEELTLPADSPSVSRDGLTMVVADRTARLLHLTTRPTRGDPWGTPAPITELDSGTESGACLFAANLALVFTSRRPDGSGVGGENLWLSTRSSTTTSWSDPTAMTGINTAADDDDPCMHPGGEWLYFGSQRSGNEDVWLSRRSRVTGTLEAPVPVDSINTSSDDDDPWVSTDDRYMIFASNRGGDVDLYEVSR